MSTIAPTAPPRSLAERKSAVEHMHEQEGMSLKQIAVHFGVSRTTIANWRRGRSGTDYECQDCGNPMMRKAIRCGMCIEEAEREQMAVAA